MNKEYFKILKEMASLQNLHNEIVGKIEAENKRIAFVQSQRQKRLDELDKLTKQKDDFEARLSELEKQSDQNINSLNHLEANLKAITTVKEQQSLESEIEIKKKTQIDIEKESDQIFDELDSLEQELNKAQNFAQGSADSLNELKEEVSAFIQEQDQQKAKLEHRIKLLLEELPANFQNSYQRVSSKHLPHGPFSKINAAKQCQICGFKVNSVLDSDVEEKLLLKTCSSCGRIFIPGQANY